MRLGGPTHDDHGGDPGAWIVELKRLGYSAAYCPVQADADDATVAKFTTAAAEAEVVIAEVGAWSNPLSADDAERKTATAFCQGQLALAERIGARCCVNIAGSRGAKWDGPCPADLSGETFEMIVASVREIIDAVKPTRTFYTLETMPWMVPDSAETYLKLIAAIDREGFAVHLDPVNLINCPRRYFDTAAVLRDCFAKLGPRVRSCHAKDIRLGEDLTVHLSEVPPGDGGLDYGVFLAELDRLDADVPLMLEHMQPEQYAPAAEHVRAVARQIGVTIR